MSGRSSSIRSSIHTRRTAAGAVALLLALGVLAAPRPAAAGRNLWTPFGPEGGGLFGLAVHPHDARILYAIAGSGVVKSVDGGQSWQAAAAGLEAVQETLVAIDPAAPSRLYAVVRSAVHGGVFRSDDAGAHWKPLFGDEDLYWTQSITVLPDGVVLVGTGLKLWRATDQGTSWAVVFDSTHDRQFHSLVWSPAAPATVYAGALDLRLRSDDGGLTWIELSEGPPQVNALAVAPSDPHLLYETGWNVSGFATWRSRDGGATWEGPFRFAGDRLLVDPRNPDVVYGRSYFGLYVSRDGAETFHKARRGLPPLGIEETDFYGVAALASAPTGDVLVATDQGLLRSGDTGYHWAHTPGRGLRDNRVTLLRLDPHDPAHYLLRSFNDFYATRDGGCTFTPTAEALRGRTINALEFDPFTPGRLLAVAWGRVAFSRFELLESTDGGATWQSIGPRPPADATGLLFAAPDVLMTVTGSTIWRSANGEPWKRALQATCRCSENGHEGVVWFRRLVADPSRPETFYAQADVIIPHSGLPPRIYRSTDGGRRWSLWADGYRTVALDPNEPGVVYVALNSTVFRTRNGGRSFETMGSLPSDGVATLVADRERAGVLYATTWSHGVWRSSDRGRAWKQLPGLPHENEVGIADFAQDRENPDRLLVAPTRGGLWRGVFDLP